MTSNRIRNNSNHDPSRLVKPTNLTIPNQQDMPPNKAIEEKRRELLVQINNLDKEKKRRELLVQINNLDKEREARNELFLQFLHANYIITP